MKNYLHSRSRHIPEISVCILSALLFHFSAAPGQSNPFTFGLVREIKSVADPIGLLKGDFNGDKVEDIASYNSKKIRIQFQLRDSLGFSTRTFTPAYPFSTAAAAKTNDDEMSDIICLGGKPLRLQVYIMKKKYEPYLILNREITGAYDKLLLSDVNNDAKVDVLLYGKKELGVMVFRGKGNGTFRPPITLFPGDSFSELCLEDINNDGVNDVVALQWIDNMVELSTGYLSSTFSEPSRIILRSEPGFMNSGYINNDDNIDFLVYFPNENELVTYLGDGLGNFDEHQIINVHGKLSEALISKINDDSLRDLLLLGAEDGSLDIHLQNKNGFYTDVMQFFTAAASSDMELFTHRRTPFQNIAILDSKNSLIKIMYSAYSDQPKYEIKEYGLGSLPSDVHATDLNSDGWIDIIVSNKGSKTFSVFLNDKKGNYNGQWTIPVSFIPGSFIPAGGKTVPRMLLSTEKGIPAIHITEIDHLNYTFNQSKIITQDIPEILHASAGSPRDDKTVISLGHDPESDQLRLSFIRWKNGSHTTESVITPGIQGNIIAVSNLLYARGDRWKLWCSSFDGKNDYLYYIVTDSVWNIAEKKLFYSVGSDTSVSRLLWNGDLNRDGQPDCIVFRKDSMSNLYIYPGGDQINHTIAPLHVFEDVETASAKDIKITDIDKNGNPDIVVHNRLRRSLDAYVGNGTGQFWSMVNLAGTARWGGFDISDVDNNGYPEVIVSDTLSCTLKILPIRER